MKQEAEKDNDEDDATPDKKQKDKKNAGVVQLKADNKKKSLDQKKKDKGCC